MEKAKPEFKFMDHYPATKLTHVPVHGWVTAKFLNHELDPSRLPMKDDPVTFFDLFTGFVFEFHSVLRQIHAAIDVEDVAGDVGGFVAGEEDDGRCNILAGAHAAERNAHFQFFFYLVGENGGHG
jgi:hypothetical protein